MHIIRSSRYGIVVGALIAFAACTTTQPLAAQSVKQVTVTVDSTSLALGHRTTARARVRLANGTYATNKPVAWGTSKPGVALVSDKGVVSSIAVGSATIVATVSGVVGQAVIAIAAPTTAPRPPSVASVAVSLAAPTLAIGATTHAEAVPRDSSGDVLTNRAITWTSSSQNVATVSSDGLVTAVSAGTASIRATVDTKTAAATMTVAAPPDSTLAPRDTLAPELPRVLLDTRMVSTPITGRTLLVAGNLQAALDSAAQGDKITLPCGSTYRGNFTWGNKTGAGWSALQPASTMCTAPEGVRITPHVADSLHLPRLLSLGAGSALQTAISAHKLRVISLEIAADSTTSSNTNGLLAFGNGDETQLAQLPSDIIIDRCYIHGRANLDVRRGVTMNSARTAIVDSWIAEIHSLFDSNGIGGWNGPGPYKIANNTIQSAGVSIGSGGAHVYLANNVPSDWEIRHNWMTKDLTWKGTWVLKNNLEFKNAQRVLIEGNVLDNSVQDAQSGYAFVLWSADQDGAAPWSTTNNLTIRLNLIRNVAGGWNLSAHGYQNDETEPMHHVAIANNVVIGLDAPASAGVGQSVSRLFQVADVIPNLTIEHNTGFSANVTFVFGGAKPLPALVIKNNLTGGGQYQFSNGLLGAPAWAEEAGQRSAFLGNVFVLWGQFSGAQIAGNTYPSAFADLSLVGGPTIAFSPTAAIDGFALTPATWLSGTATDGKDPGADIAAVKAAIAGVVIVP